MKTIVLALLVGLVTGTLFGEMQGRTAIRREWDLSKLHMSEAVAAAVVNHQKELQAYVNQIKAADTARDKMLEDLRHARDRTLPRLVCHQATGSDDRTLPAIPGAPVAGASGPLEHHQLPVGDFDPGPALQVNATDAAFALAGCYHALDLWPQPATSP